MRSLPLLVLLLFAVIVSEATSSPTLLAQLLAGGVPQRLKSACDAVYLTDKRPTDTGGFFDIYSLNVWGAPRQVWGPFQDYTFEQINDHEVAIKSNRGLYLGYGSGSWAKQVEVADELEMMTPVKNADGSWSFKSREDRWLSTGERKGTDHRFIIFKGGNKECERWWLEPATKPETPPLIAELLEDGGRRTFKAFNDMYLTYLVTMFLTQNENIVKPWTGAKEQYWTIEQINESEVAIRSTSGRYISHSYGDEGRPLPEANDWEMLTPVKNSDGTWSFKSRYHKWLSGGGKIPGKVHFMPNNYKCERWKLSPW